MPDWRQEYVAGIRDAEKQHPVNQELIAAYSQLLDRISVLEAEKAAHAQPPTPPTISKPSQAAPPSPSPGSSADDSPLVARLRLELAEALRAKGQFQQRLQVADEELARLRSKTTADTKTLRDLTAERRTLTFRLRDRDEELRVKTKLVADVQDELAVLNMQLDVVERKRAEKEAENKQLVERFMKRVGQEAEAMNLANEPLFNRKR
ncbi:autophagy-related protein 16 [Parachaetomium inaequale]|uniref:Autophagy-related protein 16 n=1 Tax=Parachaetomium inaequale TaxID=2588326 RepID=A0AAN6PU79_9PEZI|nr:autophagy-related protein 16 [Parachaetomium inaequale]